MILYSFVAFFPLLVSLIKNSLQQKKELDGSCSQKREFLWVLLAMLPMFLFYVLRHNTIGTDTFSYTLSFAKMPEHDLAYWIAENTKGEPGYVIYCKLLSFISTDYTFLFFVNALIMFGALLYFAKVFSKDPCTVLFLFITLGLYNFYLTGMRQALAMSFCLFSLGFAQKNKFIRFFLLVLLGASFHKSAFLFLSVYPLSRIKKTQTAVFLYVLLAIIGVAGFSFFTNTINQLLGYSYGIEETGNGGVFFVVLLLLLLFVLDSLKLIEQNEENTSLLLHLTLLSVLFWCFRLISRTAERPAFYFIPGVCALVSQSYVYGKRDALNRLLRIGVVFGSLALFLYRNIGVFRYEFFWSV